MVVLRSEVGVSEMVLLSEVGVSEMVVLMSEVVVLILMSEVVGSGS